ATSVRASSQGPLAQAIVGELVEKHGEPARARAGRGVKQVLAMWRAEDGDDAAVRAFAVEHFASGADALKTLLGRYEEAFEQLDGHLLEIGRAFRSHNELELGPQLPIDHLFAAFEVSAHVSEDLF